MISRLVFLLAIGLAGSLCAAELRIVTWNLEHLMSRAGFERWRGFCEPNAFSDNLAEQRGIPRPKTLTFCSAHSGLGWPPRKTQPKLGVSACPQASPPIRDLATHDLRVHAMRQVIEQLVSTSDVFLFQEVIDEDALAELFGPLAKDFHLLPLHQMLPQSHWVAQNLAAAVKKSRVSAVSQEAYTELGQLGDNGHRVRSGQVLQMRLTEGMEISVLNVHLKAGCNQFDMQDPWAGTKRNDPDQASQTCDPYPPSKKPPSLRDVRVQSCTALRRQLEPLEAWVDQQSRLHRAKHFIIAGDFNRRLLWELSHLRGPARIEDESPTKPFNDSTIRLFWPELNDGEPSGARLRLALPERSHLRAGVDAPEADAPAPSALGCKHMGIDHIAASESLAGSRSERLGPLMVHPIPVFELASAASNGKTKLGLSDHCPHSVQVKIGF